MIQPWARHARTLELLFISICFVLGPHAPARALLSTTVEPPEPEAVEVSGEPPGFFVEALGGLGIPVTGPLADDGALGLWGGVAVGLGYRYGLAGFVEIGFRHHVVGSGYVSSGAGVFDAFGVLVGGRLTVLENLQIHPFGEAGLGIQFVSSGPGTSGLLASSAPVFALLCSAGLQFDLTPQLSIEGIIRADLLFTNSTWSNAPSGQHGNTLMLSPMLRGSFYF